jgi:hypothetical protein
MYINTVIVVGMFDTADMVCADFYFPSFDLFVDQILWSDRYLSDITLNMIWKPYHVHQGTRDYENVEFKPLEHLLWIGEEIMYIRLLSS